MKSEERRAFVKKLIVETVVTDQDEILSLLKKKGIEVTQSTLSRDLAEIGARKQEGRYVLRVPEVLGWTATGFLGVVPAGDHLLVIRTEVGSAQRVGVLLDALDHPGVIGTIAGDDTIFVALEGPTSQRKLMECLEEVA